MPTILTNLQTVKQHMQQAAQRAGRSVEEIRLLAVSKSFGAEAVMEAVQAGQYAFAENYLQEALDKMTKVRHISPGLALEWHFIGLIQSNKTRLVAQNFSWVHSVDRLKIAERLSEQRPPELPPLNICLQVNISEEETKNGVPLNQAVHIAKQIAVLPRLQLRGLMVIPEPAETLEQQRIPYRRIKALYDQLNDIRGVKLDTLSMGMSADMEAAILEGSTLVRIGSAIFGKRNYVS